ncbi:unnamed protein product [Clonostachys chloroleuca]|uniref:NADPH--cytochrome P450 reductase n=1 Tax=Clonostachys chloroleuca TaxID=1926264 RepID=A0AA35VLT8_9HYPO|nr:unnamed protein product [Clonostachys chloroleuca]
MSDTFNFPFALPVTLSLDSLPPLEARFDDAIVILIVTILFTYNYWIPFFRESIHPPHSWLNSVPQANGDRTSSRQQKEDERRAAYVFEQQKLDFLVFWGSQSGRAEIIARQFAKSLQDRFGLRTLAADLDDFDHAHLSQLTENHLCAFIVSTYGDGDPPDGANGLWTVLHKEKSTGSLSKLRYVMFGLGNSNYRLFNQVAITIDGLLQKHGASRFGSLGAGDDAQGDTENGFLLWRQEVQSELQRILGWKEQKVVYHPSFKIEEQPDLSTDGIHVGEPVPHTSSKQGAVTPLNTAATVKEVYKLWEDSERLCLHVDLDLGSNRELKYKTGDHLAVWASNPDHEVNQLLQSLGLSSKKNVPITISEIQEGGYGKIPFPTPTTFEALFRNYLEISGKLSMDLVHAIAEFAPSEEVRSVLNRIGTDAEEFKSNILAAQLTLGGLLKQLDPTSTWAIPVSFLMERLKPMQPRYYSISSSAVVQPRVASITVVVTKPKPGKTPTNTCEGLATGYLWAVERSVNKSATPPGLPNYAVDGPRGVLAGGKVFSNTIQSTFKLPLKGSAPIIMVGAGTGVAPFRAFVQERVQRKEFGQEVGKTLLLMGFRNSANDYIYKDNWAEWQQSLGSDVFSYYTAFSRDIKGKKMYVQDLLEQQESEVMDLMEGSGCRFYICGSATMARGVVDSLAQMKSRRTGCSREESLKWVKDLRKFNTLLEDVWG